MTVLGKVNLWLTGQHRLDKPKRKAPAAPTGGSPRSCNVSFRKDGVDYAFRERVPEKGEGCCGTSAPARPGVVCRGHRSGAWTRELFIGESGHGNGGLRRTQRVVGLPSRHDARVG